MTRRCLEVQKMSDKNEDILEHIFVPVRCLIVFSEESRSQQCEASKYRYLCLLDVSQSFSTVMVTAMWGIQMSLFYLLNNQLSAQRHETERQVNVARRWKMIEFQVELVRWVLRTFSNIQWTSVKFTCSHNHTLTAQLYEIPVFCLSLSDPSFYMSR